STISTRVNLVNPTASTANVTLRANNKSGAALTAPVNVTLAAGQQYQKSASQIFGFSAGVLTEGSLIVESNISGLVGDVVYSDPTGTKPFRTALTLETQLTKSATFSQVDNSPGRYTEVDITNPNSQTVAVDISVYRAEGSR